MTSTDEQPRAATAAEDVELLRHSADNDAAAFAALYDRFSSMAFAVALRITADTALAEDVVHDSFLSVWRGARSFDPARGSVKTWLLSIVHNRAIDEVRRRRATEALPDPDADVPPAPLTVPDLWQEVAGRLDADLVRSALAKLSTVQREAVELAFYGGLTQDEIALRTGTPLGTVKGRMRLGLQTLRRLLAREVADRAALSPPSMLHQGAPGQGKRPS